MSRASPKLLDRLPHWLRVPYLALTLIVAWLLLGSQIQQQGRGLDDAIHRNRATSALAFLSTFDREQLPSWKVEDPTKGDKLYGPIGVTAALFLGRLVAPWIGDVQDMRWLDFHAGLSLWFLVLFWATCHLGRRATSLTAGGALAGLLLLLQPRILGLATVNPSDLPAAAATALALLALWRWWDKQRWLDLTALCASLALCTAIRAQNSLSTTLPLLIGATLLAWLHERRHPEARALPLAQLLLAPALTYAFFILFWFDFWSEPIQGPIQLIRGFLDRPDQFRQTTLWFGESRESNLYAPIFFALTTPLWILFPFFLGIFLPKGRTRPLFWTLGLWMLLSIGKHLTGIANNGGIRHFMDAYVPVSIFAAWAILWLKQKLNQSVDMALLAVLFLYFPLNARGHPYESSYYNLFIGGPRGAAGKLDLEPDSASFVQLLFALRPELQTDDILVTVGPSDLVTQLRLPDGIPVHELLPDSEALFQAHAEQLFAGHRVLLLYGQDRHWGNLDSLIRDGVLRVVVQRGVADLPVLRALEVMKAEFWQRLPEVFGR